VILEDKLIFRL